MTVSQSLSKSRMGVVVNYALLVLTLLVSQTGQWFDWSLGIKICFCLLAISVIATFFSVHVRTGLWRLVHAKVGMLDERETQQNLESIRLAYVVFTIVSLLILLMGVVFGWGGQTSNWPYSGFYSIWHTPCPRQS